MKKLKYLKLNFKIFLIALLLCFILLGHSFYQTSVYASTKINESAIEQIVTLEKFDQRENAVVPSVKDQGSSNICWAYACTNLAEVSILHSKIDSRATKDNLSFSPEALAKSVYLRGKDPLNNVTGWQTSGDWYSNSGSYLYGADMFSQWCAPVNKAETVDYYTNCAYRLTDAVEYNFTNPTVDYMIPIVKKAIAEYGAIATSYLNGRDTLYYNPKNENSGTPHAIIIIGWDDTIDKSKFTPGTTIRDGGWIVKNSYSSNQYFYMSYDKLISSFMTLRFATNEDYQFNYFYDSASSKVDSNGNGGNTLYKTNKAANVFVAKMSSDEKKEYLKAVNVHFTSKNTTCKVEIYTDLMDPAEPTSGTLAGFGTDFFEYGGYRTVKLNSPIKLNKNSYFSVVVELSSDADAKITCSKQISNNSYVYTSYGYWNKINSGNTPRIKAYTSLLDDEPNINNINISNANLNLEYNNVIFSGKENKPKVVLTYNNKTLVENVDYTINYQDNVAVGKAKIIITGINDFTGQRLEYFDIVPTQNEANKNSNDHQKNKLLTASAISIICVTVASIAPLCFILIKRKKVKK